MLVNIPDELIEDLKLLDRISSGRIKGIWPRVKGAPPEDRKIEMARYRISELVYAAILKEAKKRTLYLK